MKAFPDQNNNCDDEDCKKHINGKIHNRRVTEENKMFHIQFERAAPGAFQIEKQKQVVEFQCAIGEKSRRRDHRKKDWNYFRAEGAFPAIRFPNFPKDWQSQKNSVAVRHRSKKCEYARQPELFSESIIESCQSQK